MDKNQLEGICGEQIKFGEFSELTPENIIIQISKDSAFTMVNATTYYREIKVENGRRYILCFNPQLFTDQRNARDKSIELFRDDILTELNEELKCAKKSRAHEVTADKFKNISSKII